MPVNGSPRFAPMHYDGDLHLEENWQQTLAEDYWRPHYHVDRSIAIGRRIRSNYFWILLIQAVAYIGNLIAHPVPIYTIEEVIDRADVGPIPGELMIFLGMAYVFCLGGMAFWAYNHDALEIAGQIDV